MSLNKLKNNSYLILNLWNELMNEYLCQRCYSHTCIYQLHTYMGTAYIHKIKSKYCKYSHVGGGGSRIRYSINYFVLIRDSISEISP